MTKTEKALVNRIRKNAKLDRKDGWNSYEVKWNKLTDDEMKVVIRWHASQDEDASFGGYVQVNHSNKYIQEKIDEQVPFTIDVVEMPTSERRCMLIPNYSGPSRVIGDERNRIIAEMIPFILPCDTIIQFLYHEETKSKGKR